MDLFDLVATLSLDTSQYEQGLKDSETKGGNFGGGLAKAAKAGAVALGAAVTATVAFGKSAVDAGQNFDKSMSQVAATMGKSVDEIGELRDFAQQMGATTAFSATEAADALNYMALAGYDAGTSMSMLPNVLNLAAAGNMDLARASDMVTDAQTALGLELDETSIMVDQMAKASSTTNTSVEQLGDAFLTVGGVAKNLSGGTAELSGVLGALADNGIKGSEAGTKLRNIILAMNPTTDDAVEAFEQLGINAYDAQGNMRPLQDVFLEMQGTMKDMSSQEKTDLMSKIFNKQDLAAANALLDTNVERWGEIDLAIADAKGSADQMAKTQLDNLAGDITLFKSALEGAQIVVSDALTPTLRDFVQMGSEGLSKVTQAAKEEGLGGAMEALGDWISDALAMVVEKIPLIVDAGAKVLMALINGIIENLPMLAEAAMQIILNLAQSISANLPTLIPAMVEAVVTMVTGLLDNIDLLVSAAAQLILGLAEGLIKAIPSLLKAAPKIIKALVGALVKGFGQLVSTGINAMKNLLSGIVKGFASIPSKLIGLAKKIPQAIKSGVGSLLSIGHNMIEGLWNGIKSKFTSVTEKVKALASKLPKAVKKVLGIESPSKVFMEIGKWIPEGLALGIEKNLGSVYNASDALADATLFEPSDGEYGEAVTNNITFNIYATPNQSARDIAEEVKRLIIRDENQRRYAWV